MRHFNIFALAVLIVFSFTSCEKVIDLKIDNAEPRLVASGYVSSEPGPYIFRLSQTIDYDKPNNFPSITGATLILKDDIGNTETLTEEMPGEYWAKNMQGTPGRTYSLNINVNGKEYTSTVPMAAPVSIDSITIEALNTLGGEIPLLTTYFKDPAGEKNYYYLEYLINGIPSGDKSFLSDDLQDGEEINVGTISDEYEGVQIGDTITVLLQCIDASMYEFYRTLEALEDAGGGGIGATTPDNPTPNITGDILGYFKVYSQTEKDFIIQ